MTCFGLSVGAKGGVPNHHCLNGFDMKYSQEACQNSDAPFSRFRRIPHTAQRQSSFPDDTSSVLENDGSVCYFPLDCGTYGIKCILPLGEQLEGISSNPIIENLSGIIFAVFAGSKDPLHRGHRSFAALRMTYHHPENERGMREHLTAAYR
jgi:hypothetical protein